MLTKTLSLVFVFFVISESKYVDLELSEENEEWLFLTRFCYLSENGKIKYEVKYSNEYGPYQLLLYYNTDDQWESVYKSDKNCSVKSSEPYISEAAGQVINLNPYATKNAGNCSLRSETSTVYCTLEREFQSSTQRWWYMALARCDDTVQANSGQKKGLNVDVKLTLTNGNAFFFKHFSADEFYILQVDMSFLILFVLILVIAIICAVSLHQRKFYHTTYKLFLASLSLQTFYLFFITLAYGLFASDGVDDKYPLKMFARVLDIASYLLYILMLILMGKGFTITRGKIQKSGAIKIAIFLLFYTIGYIVLFIFEARFFDPGEVLYLYQSPPGYALVAMRILAWAWFCYAVFFTLKHFPEKKKFYIPFFIIFTMWFWANPIVILIANFVIGEHIRATIVNGVLIFIKFVGYLLFLFLTLPCCVGSVFPYHIRTTQITVISADQYPHQASDEYDGSGSSEKSQQKLVYGNSSVLANGKDDGRQTTNLNGPASHVSPRGAPNFVDLFLVANTHSNAVKKFRYNRVDELEGRPGNSGLPQLGSLPPIAAGRTSLPPINAGLTSPRPAGLVTAGIMSPRQPTEQGVSTPRPAGLVGTTLAAPSQPNEEGLQTSRYAAFETGDKEEVKDGMVGKSLEAGSNPFITKQ